MADYIRREDALFALRKAERGGSMTALTRLKRAYAEIREMPAADVAEVVRCKDCIRRYDTDECPMCFLIEGKYYEYTNGNGFCDRGERKEGAE